MSELHQVSMHHHLWFHIYVTLESCGLGFFCFRVVRVWNECVIVSCVKKVE